jgi:pimeloyl-ACP methyl ester carboxylesterase
VLLHGIMGSERVWSRVLPMLAPHNDVIAPTALGHRGGHPATVRPTRLEHIVDDAERLLDELGLEKVHFAGNSLGGRIALELARRGRARTVCALSPAGTWEARAERHQRATESLRAAARATRRSRAVLPLLVRSRRFRHWALRGTAAHGERASGAELLGLVDDLLGCEVREDLFEESSQLTPLDPPPCAITLAWAGRDRLFPVEVNGARARELIPGARFIVLDDVGHIPMIDDPQLVAQTILAATAANSHGA